MYIVHVGNFTFKFANMLFNFPLHSVNEALSCEIKRYRLRNTYSRFCPSKHQPMPRFAFKLQGRAVFLEGVIGSKSSYWGN